MELPVHLHMWVNPQLGVMIVLYHGKFRVRRALVQGPTFRRGHCYMLPCHSNNWAWTTYQDHSMKYKWSCLQRSPMEEGKVVPVGRWYPTAYWLSTGSTWQSNCIRQRPVVRDHLSYWWGRRYKQVWLVKWIHQDSSFWYRQLITMIRLISQNCIT